MQANIETFIGCDADFAEADLVLFGAPFDSTTSFRPGARFGPSAMRHESFIWSSASAVRRRRFMISRPGRRRFSLPESFRSFWAGSIW